MHVIIRLATKKGIVFRMGGEGNNLALCARLFPSPPIINQFGNVTSKECSSLSRFFDGN